MATHDYVIDNQSASSFRSDLNNVLQAIVSQNSSATAPTTTYADMFWYDTANNQLKKRNEANSAWITLGTVDEGAGTFTPTGGGLTANVQEFTSSGTWTMPANAKLVVLELWSAGGGGGSGNRGAAANWRTGGGGGGGGGCFVRVYRASELTSTVSVTIGSGGAGAAAVTVNTTNGAAGSNGGNSLFGSYVTVKGGVGGSGGVLNTSSTGGLGGLSANDSSGANYGGLGGDSNTSLGGVQYPLIKGALPGNGGGGGGLINSANTNVSASLGGNYVDASTWVSSAFANGVGASVNGAAGSSFGVGGGGGGPGSAAAAGSGGAGGTAAGGGGGGGSLNGFNSGAGGAGGNGFCRVTTYS